MGYCTLYSKYSTRVLGCIGKSSSTSTSTSTRYWPTGCTATENVAPTHSHSYFPVWHMQELSVPGIQRYIHVRGGRTCQNEANERETDNNFGPDGGIINDLGRPKALAQGGCSRCSLVGRAAARSEMISSSIPLLASTRAARCWPIAVRCAGQP